MPRLTSKSMLVCHLDLGWGDSIPCRNKVQNKPEFIRRHMIDEHEWNEIPQLVHRDISENKPHPKTKEIMTVKSYLEFISENPKEWFLDNQFWYQDFKTTHFHKPTMTTAGGSS